LTTNASRPSRGNGNWHALTDRVHPP
jgi:hypothetical protein